MDGEQRLDADEGRVAGEYCPQIGGDQAGLPVVAMNHLRPEDAPGDLERGAAKQAEANVVIGEISARIAIQSLAVVEFRTIEKIVGDRFTDLVDAGGVGNASQPDGKDIVNTTAFGRNTAIPRQQHRDVFAHCVQSRRQGTDHVGQSASLGERPRFGGDHQDFRHAESCTIAQLVG